MATFKLKRPLLRKYGNSYFILLPKAFLIDSKGNFREPHDVTIKKESDKRIIIQVILK